MREQLDYSKINFPTDRLTVGQLRRMDKAAFPHGGIESRVRTARLEDAKGLYHAWVEHHAAECVFGKAAGRGDHPSDLVECVIEELNEFYVEMGWSSGAHQTTQLVNRFLDAARSQARKIQARGR